MSKFSRYFTLHKKLEQETGCELNRSELIQEFTNGRKQSLKALSFMELNELCGHMQHKIASTSQDKGDVMRKKIISLFRKMGYEDFKGKADMARIYTWVKHYGKFKKPLNGHSISELASLVSQVDKMYVRYLEEIHKPVTVR